MKTSLYQIIRILIFSYAFVLSAIGQTMVSPELNENCTVSILNRSAQVGPGGYWGIANVPVEPGFFRVRVYCTKDGVTTGGQSEFFRPSDGIGSLQVSSITLGQLDPLPVSLALAGDTAPLDTEGKTVQLTATATLPDGTTKDVTAEASGTFWSSSNSAVASVSINGLVTARERGTALIQVRNEGVIAAFEVTVLIPNDSDKDGLSDEFELASGLNPNDPADAARDADGDGLSTLEEFLVGTNHRSVDTDGDDLTDSQEISQGFNPTLADTDGDGLSDGNEVALGTDPRLADGDNDGISDRVELDLGLDPKVANVTTTVSGIVLDEAGKPVAGAGVVTFNSLTASTGSDGYFEIRFVPADRGNIVVSASLFRAGMVLSGFSSSVAPAPADRVDVGNVTIRVNSGAVSGVVTSPSGRFVRDAAVTLVSGEERRETRTDGFGRYLFENVSVGMVDVSVRDFSTGLLGRGGSELLQNQSTVINIQLGAFASIVGTALGTDNATPVGANIQVSLVGPVRQTVRTDLLGRYRFDFLPLGNYTVSTADNSGNRGSSAVSLSTTSQVVVADVGFLGRAKVLGNVVDASGAPVPSTTVTLNSQSIFGGRSTQDTGSLSAYEFEDIFVGGFNVTAVSEERRQAGSTAGEVLGQGVNANANIALDPAGRIRGTVLAADGVSAVSGVVVELKNTGLQATSDSTGAFDFPFVPLGSYTLRATDPVGGDRAEATARLSQQDEVATANIALSGFGSLRVFVTDAANQPVPGVQVTAQPSLGAAARVSNTDVAGAIRFEQILAGPVSVQVRQPLSNFSSSGQATVAVGAETSLTLKLDPAGMIQGTIFLADGVTHAAGIRLQLVGRSGRVLNSSQTGRFQFDLLSLGNYTLLAFDRFGSLRAEARDLIVSAQGETLNRNLSLSGTATVTGLVLFPDGSPASSAPVTLQPQGAQSQPRQLVTDVDGRYNFVEIPVGSFSIESMFRRNGFDYFGRTADVLEQPNQLKSLNLQLSDTLVPVRTSLHDGNGMSFTLRESGNIENGTRSVFAGDGGANKDAAQLEILVNGAVIPFIGSPLGGREENGREVVTRQNNLAGLEVTRKVYVPEDGYFARYLETLHNSTAQPITAAVRVSSSYRFIQKVRDGFRFDTEPRVISTSSGDALLQSGSDAWVTIDDDQDGDPFLDSNNLPTTLSVFGGAEAVAVPRSLQFIQDFASRYGKLEARWEDATIPPGGSISLLHFVAQQTSRASAVASASRLSQLPPEALVGLSTAEIQQITNFTVPADGIGSVSPLPPLVNVAEGRVLAGNSSSIISGAETFFQSSQPIFSRTHRVVSLSDGSFRFSTALGQGASNRIIPAAPYEVRAIHPASRLTSPVFSGSFASAGTSMRDVIFSNSGQLVGTVRRATGEVVVGADVTVTSDFLVQPVISRSDSEGNFLFTGLPAGSVTATAMQMIRGGSPLVGASSATISSGQTTIIGISLQPSGSVTGLLTTGRGLPAVNRPVTLSLGSFRRSLNTDSGGRYLFDDIPVGDYQLSAVEPQTGIASTTAVRVVRDVSTTQNLRYIGIGSLQVRGEFSDGTLVAGARVEIAEQARGGGFRNLGTLAANGLIQVAGVPVGDFTVRLISPRNSTQSVSQAGTILADGSAVSVTLLLPLDALPSVQINAPPARALEFTIVNFTASASDDIGVSRVDFRIDGLTIGRDFTAPYQINYRLQEVSEDRTVEVSAVAIDSAGQSSTVSVASMVIGNDITPPTITLTSPSPGETYREGQVITVRADAGDNLAVEQVTFRSNNQVFGNDSSAPYAWSYQIPNNYLDANSGNLSLEAEARDVAGNVRAVSSNIQVIRDDPPTLSFVSPTDGQQVTEGSTVSLTANAIDDFGVSRVDFYTAGKLIRSDTIAPYEAEFQLPAGTEGDQVELRAVAIDTINQTSEVVIQVSTLDDIVAPTLAITSPKNGSIVTVGESDVALVIDTSGSTSSSSGSDVTGDGVPDNILTAEIVAARELLDFFDPATTKVAVIDFSSDAIVRQQLTNDYAAVRAALDLILRLGPGGGTNFAAAMEQATNELAGTGVQSADLQVRRNATPVQLFLSDGSASFPDEQVARAVAGGVIVNSFAVGAGADTSVLTRISNETGGVFTPVINSSDLIDILPNIILFGINQLPVTTTVSDNGAVEKVDVAAVSSPVGAFATNFTITGGDPFQGSFGLPVLENRLQLQISATATDFGGNISASDSVNVTVLPATNSPQISFFTPAAAQAGSIITINGRFFDPVPSANSVTLNNMPLEVLGGDKLSLQVRLPADAVPGPIVVRSNNLDSAPLVFAVLVTGSVQINLTDASGNAVPGARVELETFDGTLLTDTTNLAGELLIPNITGSFNVRANSPFNPSFAQGTGLIMNQGETVPINLVLPGTGSARVRVVDENGTPVNGASIRVAHNIYPGSFVAPSTNADGESLVSQIPIGNFSVSASTGGLARSGVASGEITSLGEIVEISITLNSKIFQIDFPFQRRLCTFSAQAGDVIRINMNAVRENPEAGGIDTYLELYSIDFGFITQNDDFNGLDSFIEFVAQSDAQYIIVSRGFSSSTGPYELSISSNDAPIAPLPFVGGTVFGKVLDNGTTPHPGAEVKLLISSSSGGEDSFNPFSYEDRTVVDDQGRFRFEHVPYGVAGNFTVQASEPQGFPLGESSGNVGAALDQVEIDIFASLETLSFSALMGVTPAEMDVGLMNSEIPVMNIRRANNQNCLCIAGGEVGDTWVIEASDSMQDWTEILRIPVGDRPIEFIPPGEPQNRRFFRATRVVAPARQLQVKGSEKTQN